MRGPAQARLSPVFTMAFQQLITEPFEDAAEVRVGRNHAYASIRYTDGGEEHFGNVLAPLGLRTEGVIPGTLIRELREALG